MRKILISLIHNNNENRNSYIRPKLINLKQSLLGQFGIELIEAAYQPAIKSHGFGLSLLRDYYHAVVDYKWRKYRGLPAFLFINFAKVLIKFCKKMFDFRNKGDWRVRGAIEMALTDKHIRSWIAFLETDADYLICFEDDAIFRDDSVSRLVDLLQALVKENQSVYIDLAGGCGQDELQIEKLLINRNDSFGFYLKPVTNTACVYLISRPLAAAFYAEIIKRPHLRLIGADWLMNELFMILEKSNFNCNCMHADPTVFCHGSVTGAYNSLIR